MIKINPLTIIGGHYGSGKTEIAVNLALFARSKGAQVTLADIDIVNPYFRSYEQRKPLEEKGITVITGSLGGTADLPALPAELGALFQASTTIRIIDVGGDPVGARVLARYHDQLDVASFDFLFVLNANRPETASVERAKAMIEEIEAMSLQSITGIINNTHLLDETTVDDVSKGDRLARELATDTSIPYVFATLPASLKETQSLSLDVPILPLTRHMLKPWEGDKPEGEEYAWLQE